MAKTTTDSPLPVTGQVGPRHRRRRYLLKSSTWCCSSQSNNCTMGLGESIADLKVNLKEDAIGALKKGT